MRQRLIDLIAFMDKVQTLLNLLKMFLYIFSRMMRPQSC